MNKLFKKVPTQVLMVFIAFSFMFFGAFYFSNKAMSEKLVSQAQDRLNTVNATVASGLTEIDVSILNVYYTVTAMLSDGATNEDLLKYFRQTTLSMRTYGYNMTEIYGVYGYFNGEFIDGIDFQADSDFIPTNRPWYLAAKSAYSAGRGYITYTAPYTDLMSGDIITTAVMNVFDDDGNVDGVLALDVSMDWITDYVTSTRLTKNGYGVIISPDMQFTAHPDKSMINQSLYDLGDEYAKFPSFLQKSQDTVSTDFYSEQYVKNITFFKRMYNGWYVGIITPENEFYKDMKSFFLVLGLLALFFSITLSFFIVRISRQKDASEEQNRAKSNFLATMSHEIRTPMNAIIGISEIELASSDLPKHTSDALLRIHSSGYGLLGIINDILDLSKIEAGNLEISAAPYDIARLIHETVQLNIVRIGSKPIMLKLHVSEDIPSSLVGDELRIKQILNNILSNAIKYTDKGTVDLTFSYQASSAELSIVIKDTGQGMKPEDVSKLFSEYIRFNLSMNRAKEGTGLGMSITHTLVTMMGGTILVDSEFEQGTTFTVTLPQAADNPKRIGHEIANQLTHFEYNLTHDRMQIVQYYMPYGRVLVVDDVETNLFVAKGLLTPYGLKIDLLSSGAETVSAVKQGEEYDIIFLDHMMPDMDGVQTAKKLRSMGYEAPIIALTANALTGSERFFKDNGFTDYISKPIDMRQMNAVLNKYIRDIQNPETLAAANAQKPDPAMSISISSDDRLLNVFKRDAKRAIESIDWTVKNSDYDSFIITAHAMKSALANIGEFELSKVSAHLEEAARILDTKYIEAHKNDFVLRLQSLIGDDDITEDNGVTDDKEFLIRQLELFIKGCEEYDNRICESVLKALDEKPWSVSTKDTIVEISELILYSDFEAAAEITEAFIGPMKEKKIDS